MYHRVALNPNKKNSLSGKRVLDLACGRGGGLAFLAEHFEISEGVGIDLCTRQISFAQDTFKDIGGLQFIYGDIETLTGIENLSSKQFDLILSVEAWHTLPNTNQALAESKKLLDIQNEQARLIIADGFAVDRLAAVEAEFE